MSTRLEAWREDVHRIMSPPVRQVAFWMRSSVVEWVSKAEAETGHGYVDIYNQAASLSAHRQLASRHSLQMVFLEEKRAFELPVVGTSYGRRADDRLIECGMTYGNAALLDWARDECGRSYETTIFDGIRTLGAWAVVPQATISVVESGSTRQANFLAGFAKGFPPLPKL